MSNIEIGKYGENLAAEYLIKKGYKIVDRNYKYSRYGEIDIIALYNGVLCFIEVKTRTQNHYGTPFEAITRDKLLKIFSCIKNYTQKTDIRYKRCQIDAISVEINKGEHKITHIENISF